MPEYKKLTPGEFLKPGREGRGSIFIDKMKANSDFVLYDGTIVKLVQDKNVMSVLETGIEQKNNALLAAIKIKATNGKHYKLSDFAKTGEFGGKGAGSGTRAEDLALKDIKAKLQSILDAEKVPFINLKIGRRVVQCAGFESTPGTPKSDFHVVDLKGNMVAWISHKKGTKANHFQQYGGMIELNLFSEVKQFAGDVVKLIGKGETFPMKSAFARPVMDRNVHLSTLFGKDYGGSPDGIQNIDVLHQGVLGLKKESNKYIITSSHSIHHGQLATGDYEPYYYVRPEQAKNQFGIKGARFFIVSKLTALKNRNTVVI